MAFVAKSSIIPDGTRVVLKNDHESLTGILMAGTEVTVTGHDIYGYNIIDDEGHKMIDCGWDL